MGQSVNENPRPQSPYSLPNTQTNPRSTNADLPSFCRDGHFFNTLSDAYIGPKSRTERPRKTKIGTEVAHVTRDWDTTFKVKRSKVNLHRAGAYCGGFPHSSLYQM